MRAYLTCIVVGADFHDRGLVRGLVWGVHLESQEPFCPFVSWVCSTAAGWDTLMGLSYGGQLCLWWTGLLVFAASSRVCGAGAFELEIHWMWHNLCETRAVLLP